MQVRECKENDVTYGVIAIKLKNRYVSLNEAEKVLLEFMQQLQPAFAIKYTSGISITHERNNNKTTVIDYWQDEKQKDWKVKGCTDGKAITVWYIKNISCVPVYKEDCFLNGTLFTSP